MNNKNKFIAYNIAGITLIVLSLSWILPVYAVTQKELQNEASELDRQIQETSSEIAGVKAQKSSALSQITKYNEQISEYEGEISNLQARIGTLEIQIAEKESAIETQQILYDEQEEMLKKRLVAIYESGGTSYLDLLLNAKSLSDFISKYYLIEQLTQYEKDLLESIRNLQFQIENEKMELEASKGQIENSKSEVVSKKESVSGLVSKKKTVVANLTDEEKELQEELEQFEKDKKEIEAKLKKILASESGYSTYTGTPSKSGYICPLNGKSKANITTGYLGYTGHTGVDFACKSGTPIVASKGGTVVISTALRNSNGKYKSYGEYVVISHGDGAMTLYAHMSSRAVSEGQNVSQGQTIGYVGSTGNSTGPHLHFEVRINGKCVNPTPYLP